MQLRSIIDRLPNDGTVRDAIRQFNLSPIVDGKARSVKALAEQLGFCVVLRDLPRGMSGRLVQDAFSDNGYRIEVNANQSVETQRWAVLHEMGHYFLHSDHTDPFAATMHLDRSSAAFYVNPEEEREANDFAERILFGDGALEAAVSLHGNDLERIRRQFGVSMNTLKIALGKIRR